MLRPGKYIRAGTMYVFMYYILLLKTGNDYYSLNSRGMRYRLNNLVKINYVHCVLVGFNSQNVGVESLLWLFLTQ